MAENMIKFLRGNVASLPQTATAGAVYFTKDEGLYLGLEDGTYHRYGDFITVADVASLPSTGAHETCMYYCEDENILAKWDGSEWVQINKQKTLEQLGGVAKSVYEAKITLLEKADTDNAAAISDLSTYVGTVPNGDDGNPIATSVIEYVNKKTDGIATSGNLEALGARVTTAEGDIDKLEAAIGEGGSVTTAIANAKAAGDNAQADVDALAGKVGTVEDGKTVVGLIEAAQDQADKGVADAATAQARAEEAYSLADSKATMDQVNSAIAGAGHAVKSEVDQTIADMEAAYKKADSDLKTELEGKINAKVDQTAYDTKVGELDAEDERLAGLISGIDTEYKKADTALDGRIAAIEGTITGLSGAMHFKGVKTTLPEGDALATYADGDVIIVGDKEYVFNEGAFVEFGDVSAEGDRIAELETVVGKAAEGENEATGLVKSTADNAAAIVAEKDRAEAKEAELVQADIDNLAAAKKYTDDEIAELKISDYAKQADLEAHTDDTVAHITADERTAWNAAEKNAKDYADGLNTTMNTRVEALEAIDHEHTNKDLLDTYTQTEANLADAVAKKHAHTFNETELNKINEGDVAKWNSAQANAEATAAAALDAYKTTNDAEVAKKANSSDVYAKTETYTQAEVNALIEQSQQWGEF